MSSMLDDTKEYFTFSRSERRGILVLMIIILFLIVAPLFLGTFIAEQPSDNSQVKAKVDSFFAGLKSSEAENTFSNSRPIEDMEGLQARAIEYFAFDPNTVRVDELVKLGLSVKQAQVIERYRSKGGVFHRPEDFAKVYVIDSNLYKKLKPWVRINHEIIATKGNNHDTLSKKIEKPIIVELNTADTIELMKVKGVGKIFARRIVAYRNLLGGFVNPIQLNEIYGMKPETFTEIAKFITVDSSLAKTININLVTFEEIKKHPYISEYQAKAIIYYRSKVGEITNLSDLVKNKIIPSDKFIKLKSYLVLK